MNILFIHQNFPGQFRHLAPALAARGDRAVALTLRVKKRQMWNGVEILPYEIKRGSAKGIHPWAQDIETKIIRGEACYQAACALRDTGFTPDVILAHPGWGESLFLKDVWPDAKMGIYCEWHYDVQGGMSHFDHEFPAVEDDAPRRRVKQGNNLFHFEIADGAVSPTRYQADTFPPSFRDRIRVIHDGIDTDVVRPGPDAVFRATGMPDLSRKDEVITFVNRNLEPSRGYHIFMRALPDLLARRPDAQVVIIGGDEVSYGRAAPEGQTWKDIFANEAKAKIPPADWARVHFPGKIPYDAFVAMLQVSRVHVYLTYPFVLSWSLLESLAAGCAVVASDTPPLREVVTHGQNGRLVDFFDVKGLADEVCRLLDAPEERAALGKAGRDFIAANYDLTRICLPRMVAWVDDLATGRSA